MDFKELNETIPWVTNGKQHALAMAPYEGITLRMPGRHAQDTNPPGGDFVVEVSDLEKGWLFHQFTHGDLWDDLEWKYMEDPPMANILMSQYAMVVKGEDPKRLLWDSVDEDDYDPWNKTLSPKTFLYAVQCLAVAEHRRYPEHEKQGGGRYLPARFSAGIIEGLWSAQDCKDFQYRGRQGLENLIKLKGRPKPLGRWAE